MEEKEFENRLNTITVNYENAKRDLYIEYGLDQARYKKGDIIKDCRWTILIDRISVHKNLSGCIEPVYHGVELKKDLTIKKNGNRGAIYGNHGVELVKAG